MVTQREQRQALIAQINTDAYRERWVAIVQGRVVGVGLTADQAHRAAMQTRSKDKPTLLFIDENGQVQPSPMLVQSWFDKNSSLRKVFDVLRTHHIEAYLVGGAVRDLLLGREHIVDLDFAVPDEGLGAARQVADALGGAFYPLDAARGTGRVIYDSAGGKTHLDFATFRGETLAADLQDRDFTINAMALSLSATPRLIDPYGGREDLAQGAIRAVSAEAFRRDPVRILRAVRQATAFDFEIGSQTEQYLRQAIPHLGEVSPERQRDELVKLLNTPAPDQAVEMLHDLGILATLLPEVVAMAGVEQSSPHHLDVFNHTVAALQAWAKMQAEGLLQIPARFRANVREYLAETVAGDVTLGELMPLALLLHDTGKPLTRSEETGPHPRIRFLGHEKESAKIAGRVMHHFRFSGQATGFVKRVVAEHMRPLLLSTGRRVSRRAIYRLFRDTSSKGGHAGVAVALHALADHQATYPPGQGQAEEAALMEVVIKLLAAYFEQRQQVVDPPPLLTGHDLIEQFHLKEGALIGLLLRRLKEAQASGQINTREAALNFIQTDPDFMAYREQR